MKRSRHEGLRALPRALLARGVYLPPSQFEAFLSRPHTPSGRRRGDGGGAGGGARGGGRRRLTTESGGRPGDARSAAIMHYLRYQKEPSRRRPRRPAPEARHPRPRRLLPARGGAPRAARGGRGAQAQAQRGERGDRAAQEGRPATPPACIAAHEVAWATRSRSWTARLRVLEAQVVEQAAAWIPNLPHASRPRRRRRPSDNVQVARVGRAAARSTSSRSRTGSSPTALRHHRLRARAQARRRRLPAVHRRRRAAGAGADQLHARPAHRAARLHRGAPADRGQLASR